MEKNSFYYSLLSADDQARFRENTIKQTSVQFFKQYLKDYSQSFDLFINDAFVWSKAQEGHEYWHVRARNPYFVQEAITRFQEELSVKEALNKKLENHVKDLQKQIDILTVNKTVTPGTYKKYVLKTLKLKPINPS